MSKTMTPEGVTRARQVLGQLWGFGRPLHKAELGRALQLKGRDPGQTVRYWETGEVPITGPALEALSHFLDGHLPTIGLQNVRDPRD